MDWWHKIIVLQLCMLATLGCIALECVVLYLEQDLYFIFILGVLVITYLIELCFYIKIRYTKNKKTKKGEKHGNRRR